MRARTFSALAVMTTEPPPASTIISVEVPPELQRHLDRALAVAERLGSEDLAAREILVTPLENGQTSIEVLPRGDLFRRFRRQGEDELAEIVCGPAPGGRTRLVLLGADGLARVYGFRRMALSRGGSA